MGSVIKFFGIDKFFNGLRYVWDNGGIYASVRKIYLYDVLKTGKLIGEDKYGNKYYENNAYFYGRNRWVEYNPNHNLDYDGSQIPAEWYGWMHYKTDTPPTLKEPLNYKWLDDHTMNLSGTPEEYVPWSTTRPKVETWVPKSKRK